MNSSNSATDWEIGETFSSDHHIITIPEDAESQLALNIPLQEVVLPPVDAGAGLSGYNGWEGMRAYNGGSSFDEHNVPMHEAESSTRNSYNERLVRCPICLEEHMDMTAFGCGHVTCSECYQKLGTPKLCPTCRTVIRFIIELYPINNSCPACHGKPKDMMAFGCGHAACRECGPQHQNCPICHAGIEIRVNLYL